MQRLKLFLPLIVFAIVIGFFYTTINRIGDGDYNPQALPSALVNKPFPAFQLTELTDGRTLGRSDMLGEISLVNVWGTWCPSCHVEHPYLNYLASERDIIIVGVNYNDDRDAALAWLAEKGDPYRFNIFDNQGRLGLDMGVTGAPETFVIDHRGFVRLRFQGPLNEQVWQQHFAPLWLQLQNEQRSDQKGTQG